MYVIYVLHRNFSFCHIGEWAIVVQRQFSNFSSISWREQVNFQWNDYNNEVRIILDQHAELDFSSPSSLNQQSAGRLVAPLGHIILIPSQPVFALFSLIMWRSNKYQCYSLWFDPTGAPIHDLPHSRRAR
jgi:hypothetical protein